MGGKVVVVESEAQFNELIASGKTVIVDFTATWCGPCRMIAPVFEKMSTAYEGVVFAKVDVDQLSAVAGACGIRAMPTFQVFKGGVKVGELTGASPAALQSLLQEHL